MEQVNCQLPSKKSLLIEFYSSVLSTYLNSSAAPGTYWEISHSNWLCHHKEPRNFDSIVGCIAVYALQNVKLIENVFSGSDWRPLQVPTIIIVLLSCFQGIPVEIINCQLSYCLVTSVTLVHVADWEMWPTSFLLHCLHDTFLNFNYHRFILQYFLISIKNIFLKIYIKLQSALWLMLLIVHGMNSWTVSHDRGVRDRWAYHWSMLLYNSGTYM